MTDCLCRSIPLSRELEFEARRQHVFVGIDPCGEAARREWRGKFSRQVSVFENAPHWRRDNRLFRGLAISCDRIHDSKTEGKTFYLTILSETTQTDRSILIATATIEVLTFWSGLIILEINARG